VSCTMPLRVSRIIGGVLTVCALALGCGTGAIPGSFESPEALARAVLEALEHREEGALRSLALNEQEFRQHVWPDLPASREERNLPFGYVWGDLRTKSQAHLRRTLATHGGRQYALISLKFGAGTTQYASYVVHRDTIVEVRDPQGEVHALQLFGSIIEKDRRFKVFSYVVD
jgi:hypothetical protein